MEATMTLTSDTETNQATMTVTVRVPNGTDGDLLTNAERRLSRADGVSGATVVEVKQLQPGLSATDVTVEVTIETTRTQSPRSVVESLETLTGIEVDSQ
jgi:hypothetical protein